MKAFLMTLTTLLALNAFATDSCVEVSPVDMGCSRGEFITNVGCDTHDNLRCARSFSQQELEENIIGRVVQTLEGELDPYVLGDGSLMYLKAHNTHFVVYEPLENGLIPALKELSSEVPVVVGIPRTALKKAKRSAVSEMKSLAKQFLGLKDKAEYLEILD